MSFCFCFSTAEKQVCGILCSIVAELFIQPLEPFLNDTELATHPYMKFYFGKHFEVHGGIVINHRDSDEDFLSPGSLDFEGDMT